MAGSDTPLSPDARVISCPDKQAAVAWPLPVDARLDQLLGLARDAGERTSRREIVAALVAMCDLSGEDLGALLRRYRTRRVRDLVHVATDADFVPFARQRPGPRPA
jgi:hypothetical protein